jgi:hypothetical protein
MSQQEPRDSQNRPSGKLGLITSLFIFAFILGSAIASGVTFFLLKNSDILSKSSPASPTPSLAPPPAESSPPPAAPSPAPPAAPIAVPPSPTPIASPSSSPQPAPTPQVSATVPNALSGNSQAQSQNSELPGYFPNEGFKAPPSDLSRFKKANLLLDNMVISGQRYIVFLKGKILVRGQLYSPVFRLNGNSSEQRVGFELPGTQKALLLQFGLEDLSSGDTNLTYLVRLSADGKLLWAGECRYGKAQQIVSVPLDIPGAKSLVIEYYVTEWGGFNYYNSPSLYFTRAEMLEE